MFTKIPNELLWSKRLNDTDKLIVCIIASYNPCFCSFQTFCELTHRSKASVSRSIKKLKRDRVIYQYKKDGTNTVYYDLNFKGYDKKIPDGYRCEELEKYLKSVSNVTQVGIKYDLKSVSNETSNNTKLIRINNKILVEFNDKSIEEMDVKSPGVDQKKKF